MHNIELDVEHWNLMWEKSGHKGVDLNLVGVRDRVMGVVCNYEEIRCQTSIMVRPS